jgi:hypothetical protein
MLQHISRAATHVENPEPGGLTTEDLRSYMPPKTGGPDEPLKESVDSGVIENAPETSGDLGHVLEMPGTLPGLVFL